MTASSNPCVIVKLGGAFFTDKLVAGKVHSDRVQRFCQNLARLMQTRLKPQGLSLILVSGGGSVGHHAAKRYGVDRGLPDCDVSNVFQMSEAMLKMKADMCRAFAAQNCPAFPLQEAALLYVDRHGDISVNPEPLLHCLDLGILPILSGGFVFDALRGVRPLNGDALVSALVTLPGLHVQRAVFLSGENGLLDEAGETVPSLTVKDKTAAKRLVRRFEDSGLDVTGGMLTKLECCFDMAECGIDVRILAGAGLSEDDLSDAILGRSAHGTRFCPAVQPEAYWADTQD